MRLSALALALLLAACRSGGAPMPEPSSVAIGSGSTDTAAREVDVSGDWITRGIRFAGGGDGTMLLRIQQEGARVNGVATFTPDGGREGTPIAVSGQIDQRGRLVLRDPKYDFYLEATPKGNELEGRLSSGPDARSTGLNVTFTRRR